MTMGVTRHLAFRGLADFLLEAIDGRRGNQEREIGARRLTGAHRTTRPIDESPAAAARQIAPRCATQPIVLRDRSTVARPSGPPILLYTRYRMFDQSVIELRAHYVHTKRKLMCSD